MGDNEQSNNQEPLAEYSVRGHLDLTEIQELDTEVPLRVAAVRDNRILGSVVIDLGKQEDIKKVTFKLEFRWRPRPCGFHLIVSRGDIREADSLGLTTVRRWVPAAQLEEQRPGRNPFVAQVGTVAVLDQIYRGWLIVCRRYTIRGRVVCRGWRYDTIEQQWVFVDRPAPGATVEAYDVDCWWWWCFKDLIKTATTDINGYFEMQFTWCCRTWFPFRLPWVIDPDLLRRIRELLERAKFPIGPFPPDPPTDRFEFQEYLSQVLESAAPETMALTSAQAPDPDPATSQLSASAQALKAVLPAAPDLEAAHVWPWWHRRDCSPDVIFRVTQPCGGSVQVIYEESTSQTRWNIPQTISVTLEANDKACCLPEQPDPPCGDCLAITGVGCVDVINIGTSAGPPDLRGYQYPNNLDRPFGGSLVIRGEFGEDSHPILDFYRVQYRKDSGSWQDADAVAGLLVNVSRRYFDPAAFAPDVQSPLISFGPQDWVSDGKLYYKTKYKYQRDNVASEPGFGWIWTRPDWLFRIASHNLPQGDGLYSFRVLGYRQAADGTLVDERIMPLCGGSANQASTVMVRVDNRNEPHAPSIPAHPCGAGTVHLCTAEPDCDFISLVKNEGGAAETIQACDIASLGNSDTLTIHFSVTTPPADKDAHLLAYSLTAHYGESGLINLLSAGTLAGDPTTTYGPTYTQALAQGATRPHWSGGSFKVTVQGSTFPVSCAYLLRLRAWKRTTHGCTSPYHFHWNVCEFSFCLTKT